MLTVPRLHVTISSKRIQVNETIKVCHAQQHFRPDLHLKTLEDGYS